VDLGRGRLVGVARKVEQRDDPTGGERSRGIDRRQQVRLIAVIVALVLLVWFALANFHRTRIEFWVFHRDVPVILVIVISGLLGALITALIMRRKPKGSEKG
jgi:uncharacterized integral membrane protein